MIMAFLREYRFWYLIYGLQALAFGLTFYLYRLPLAYFRYSLLLSSALVLIISLALFYRFAQKITLLQEKHCDLEAYLLTKPSDKAYLSLIAQERQEHANSLLEHQKTTSHLQQVVKLWVHQMKVPVAAMSLILQTEQISPYDLALQVQQLNHYLSNLLNYLKLTHKVSDFRFEQMTVRPLIVELIKDFRVHFLKKDIQLNLEGDWELVSDRKWLQFALSQLLDNALKYSKPKGKISIFLSQNGITIQDEGIGILAEDIPRLFEQGFTGFNGREHQKATGLGLYMTKMILDQLHLSITLSSQIDQGTTVVISKPSPLSHKQ